MSSLSEKKNYCFAIYYMKTLIGYFHEVWHNTLIASAFATISSAALMISPNVSFSKVVPLGNLSNLNMSSQWSGDNCSPLTNFSRGWIIYGKKIYELQWYRVLYSASISINRLWSLYIITMYIYSGLWPYTALSPLLNCIK